MFATSSLYFALFFFCQIAPKKDFLFFLMEPRVACILSSFMEKNVKWPNNHWSVTIESKNMYCIVPSKGYASQNKKMKEFSDMVCQIFDNNCSILYPNI